MAVTELRGRVMACGLHLIAHEPSGPDQLEGAVDHLCHLEDLARAAVHVAAHPDDLECCCAGVLAKLIARGVAVVSVNCTLGDIGAQEDTILRTALATQRLLETEEAASLLGLTVLPVGRHRIGTTDEVTIDRRRSTVTVPPGVALDPGGIGKGLAADLAVASLIEGGAAGALVSIGGDLAAAGVAPEPEGWRVDIERPDPGDAPLCRTTIDHGGVATSSTRSRRWVHEGRPQHHAIDPATGAPSETDLASVTVFTTPTPDACWRACWRHTWAPNPTGRW